MYTRDPWYINPITETEVYWGSEDYEEATGGADIYYESLSEAIANTRLIKAAPVMLKALEAALETVMWPSYEVQQMVEAAVREAKGE